MNEGLSRFAESPLSQAHIFLSYELAYERKLENIS